MRKFTVHLHSVALLALASCSSPKISLRQISQSDPAARDILAQSQRAHGMAAFSKIKDISVSYDGRWGAIGPRFQPALVDQGYRRTSEEWLLRGEGILAQVHQGPVGRKVVLRTKSAVTVYREGTLAPDAEGKLAAALVADAYEMFLLGPLYFQRPGITLADEGRSKVNDVPCHQILAVLRPGFGMAKEDRVPLFRGDWLLWPGAWEITP
jgi:hypothetical protein